MTYTTNELSAAPQLEDSAEELTWANLEIQKAQRQITRGVSELAEGVVSLSLVLLDIRRRRLYRFDAVYQTFEAFVEQRHGINAKTATQYVEALSSLGAAQYRTLISDVGVQRTYALAMLQRTDPALLTAFQALPDSERHAVTVAQIEAVDDAATAELRVKVAELEQDITRERGLHQQSRKRLQEAEELHQRVANDLIEERDAARQDLDQEQEQSERLRTLLAEAKRQSATAASALPVSVQPALPSAQTNAATFSEATVIGSYNAQALLLEASALAEKLSQLPSVDRNTISANERQALGSVLQRLQRVIEVVLHGAKQ